jgi:hypothetical protein
MSIHESSDSTYKTRRVISKILRILGVIAAIGMLPSYIFISGILSGMLGILARLIAPPRK